MYHKLAGMYFGTGLSYESALGGVFFNFRYSFFKWFLPQVRVGIPRVMAFMENRRLKFLDDRDQPFKRFMRIKISID